MKTGVELIAEERKRQIEEKGYSPEHDDMHINGELSLAGACYAVFDIKDDFGFLGIEGLSFPWEPEMDNREEHSRIRRLVIAGALIAAEIDRELRVEESA